MKCSSCNLYHHKQDGKIICYRNNCPYDRQKEKKEELEYFSHRGNLRFAGGGGKNES